VLVVTSHSAHGISVTLTYFWELSLSTDIKTVAQRHKVRVRLRSQMCDHHTFLPGMEARSVLWIPKVLCFLQAQVKVSVSGQLKGHVPSVAEEGGGEQEKLTRPCSLAGPQVHTLLGKVSSRI
jgi:hypothetical protein